MCCRMLLLPVETPHSLVQRGLLQEGQEALRHIRGPFVSNASLQEEALLLWQAAGCPTADTRGKSRVSSLHSAGCCV